MTLEPYSSCTVDVSFAPEVPGDYESCLKLVTTSDITIEPVSYNYSVYCVDILLVDLYYCQWQRN